MKRGTKSKNQTVNDEPGRRGPQKRHTESAEEVTDDRTLKNSNSNDRRQESRSYYSRNGSYSGYKGL